MTAPRIHGWARRAAAALLTLVAACALLADVVAPWPYEKQFREEPNSPPSRQFLMGTDELGRDRLSRLIYGTRTSLFLAPAAALLTLAGALLAGSLAAHIIATGTHGLRHVTVADIGADELQAHAA